MNKCDQDFIVAILTTRTIQEAADAVGVSPRTVSRRLADREFQKQLEDARAEMLALSLSPLLSLLGEAVGVMRMSMRDADPGIRLRAGDAVFRHVFRYLDAIEVDKRLRRQEELTEALLADKGVNRGARN